MRIEGLIFSLLTLRTLRAPGLSPVALTKSNRRAQSSAVQESALLCPIRPDPGPA
jgi:hypothetical protein